MLSIKVRVLLLSFFSLIFLFFFILIEYLHVKHDASNSNKSLRVVENISHISQSIHSLQKERGLTSIHLLNHDKRFYDKLIQQRKITDKTLKNSQNLGALSSRIQEIRNSIDTRIINEKDKKCSSFKNFYTVEIYDLLKNISLELTELNHAKKISHELYAILYLLKARENLGIFRADTLCFYKKDKLSQIEILKSIYQFEIFAEQLDYFKAHLKKTLSSDLKIYQNDDFLKLIKLQIASIEMSAKPIKESSYVTWWNDVTSVIDFMKETEDNIFKRIKKYSQENISTNERNLFWYLIVTSMAFLLISMLTISTLMRILKALSSLIDSLNRVAQTQDFSLRLQEEPKDEFGQLNSSVNKLLLYTNQLIEEKDKLASTDLLTGIMNRRCFTTIAQEEIERSHRYNKTISLIFCDIDNFKTINDTYGHDVGDEVLKSFAKNVSLSIRKNDYFVRWGGEEFIILLPEANEEQAVAFAQNLRKKIEKLQMPKVNNITCSFGVAQLKKDESLESLHKRADDAMYMAKKLGRNRVCEAK